MIELLVMDANERAIAGCVLVFLLLIPAAMRRFQKVQAMIFMGWQQVYDQIS